MKTNQVIVALDGLEREQALLLAWNLSSLVWGFKVNDLLLTCGLDIIRELKCLGNVFADPKLYDSPQIVANNVEKMNRAGADFITIHVSGGKDMIKAALDNAGNAKIIAVTALMSEVDCQQVYQRRIEETVWDFAHLAKELGVHGIICSSQQIKMLKHLDMIKIVPGYVGDYMIVGKEITKASDPIKALNDIVGDTNAVNS